MTVLTPPPPPQSRQSPYLRGMASLSATNLRSSLTVCSTVTVSLNCSTPLSMKVKVTFFWNLAPRSMSKRGWMGPATKKSTVTTRKHDILWNMRNAQWSKAMKMKCVVFCPNKYHSFEPFMCLDLVLER